MSKLAGFFSMRNQYHMNTSRLLLLALVFTLLTACSGGDVTAPPASSSSSGSGGTGGGGTTPNLSMSSMTFGVNPLSAFGTTSVSVDVLENGALYNTPVSVAFSSPCATAGKANLTASTQTVNGVATVSYVDNACAGADLVTASITDGPSVSATLTVTPADVGSITSISAVPTTITIRGTGGTETSRVTFKVFDIGGNAIGGKTVNFTLNTTVGGITLSSASSISDANGLVYVDVHAGTVGTPVRVTANTLTNSGATLSTQSSQLIISTGLPDQDSFTLSNETYNIEGWAYADTTTSLTVRLSDHFNNPVPDGTAVYFTTEGGSITPSCTTTNGACSVTLTSTDPKPTDGKVTVLAYAVGEESFNDIDGDGLADLSPNETVLDMPEAWLDTNFDAIKDDNETFKDFNNNHIYDTPDGKFNTSLCNETVDPLDPNRVSSAGSCSAQKTIHVRDSIQVIFSGSTVNLALFEPTSITTSCSKTPDWHQLTILDLHGNPMPAGTTIALSTVVGYLKVAPASMEVGNGGGGGMGLSTFDFYTTEGTDCLAGVKDNIAVEVTTPKGNSTTIYFEASVP